MATKSALGAIAGKVAIVTDGASGIGRSCAMGLADQGAIVMVTDIQDEAGKATTAEIRAKGAQAEFLHYDVTNEAEWEQVLATSLTCGTHPRPGATCPSVWTCH
jgi:NAD(P)-dependent dehydrogenase (short-subunit alcohol dehydrogenase family)